MGGCSGRLGEQAWSVQNDELIAGCSKECCHQGRLDLVVLDLTALTWTTSFDSGGIQGTSSKDSRASVASSSAWRPGCRWCRMGGRPIRPPAQISMGRVARKIDAPRITSMPKPSMIKRFRRSAIFPLTPAKNNTVANSTAVKT